MARQSFVINGEHFPTKTALKARCSAMLKQPSLSLADEEFLLSLIDGHPERDHKVGCGVQRFFIAPDGFGYRCFWIERTDGTKTDFSFNSCITPPKHENEVRLALRYLVTPQIIAFRDNAFMMARTLPCAISGQHITTEEAHVDHRPPDTFLALIERFLAARGVAIDAVIVEGTKDAVTSRALVDAQLAAAWIEFHRANAKLQIVSKRANLSQGSGRRSGGV